MILALDLGTNCGWACADGETFSTGRQSFKADRFSGGGVRFLNFRKWLSSEWLTVTHEIVFETVRRHRGTDAAHCYGGLLATLTSWCEENGIPYSGRTVQAIKKFATGKGNADKNAVIDAVRKRGFDPKDDNEADAIALLLLRLSEDDDKSVSVPAGRRRVAG